MLTVTALSKRYEDRVLFDDLSFDLPAGGRLAVLGRNGQGKSTLIKILGGVLAPTSGQVNWDMSVSWPLGFGGGFQGSLTGLDNIRFIARVYDQPIDRIARLTEAFAELGEALAMPVKYYSSGMRARLAFGLSIAIEFDCYLIDEIIAVGDASFNQKCQRELFDRRADRSFVIASHDLNLIKTVCDRALIIEDGRARMFDDVDEAIGVYVGLCLAHDPDSAFPALAPDDQPGEHAAPSRGLWWDRSAFHTSDDRSIPCPEDIDVGGRMRVLVFGPMESLPAGRWRLSLRLWLSSAAARNPFVFQIVRGDSLVERRFQPTDGGPFSVDLETDYPADTVMAVRLWVGRGAMDGSLRFEGLAATPA